MKRYGSAGALALVVVGFVLRVRGLSEYWLNPDEGIDYGILTAGSFGDFWTGVIANAHPPLYYLVLRGAGFLTWDFVWLRGTSLLFGTAAIWLFWLLGRELGGRGRAGTASGLVAAGLLAVNAEAITHSQVLRPYALVVFLLAAALHQLLRYRSEPNRRNLIGYGVLLSLAVLCHYSAALALAAFSALIVYDWIRGWDRVAWKRLVRGHAVPVLIFAGLYAAQVGTMLDSDLMELAFGPEGWLSAWLVQSPADAWNSLVSYQILLLPPSLRFRAALLMLTAIAVSALARDKSVAVLAGTALLAALAASALGVYPFGPTRHNAWLMVFTVPALGVLGGHLVAAGRRKGLLASGVLLAVLFAGAPLERALIGPSYASDALLRQATDEKVLKRVELAALVVNQLGREGEPRIILMSEQSYNLMMPLYAGARDQAQYSADSALFRFSYGAREVVVARRWDWETADDVSDLLTSLPNALPGLIRDEPWRVLLVAGGWGSRLFTQLPEFDARGALFDQAYAIGSDTEGRPSARVLAVVIDPDALTGSPRAEPSGVARDESGLASNGSRRE